MRITIQITLAVVILIAGIFIGRITVTNTDVKTGENLKADSIEVLPKFKETKIGDQIWMVENLNVDTFRDGTPIPEAKTIEEWIKAGEQGEPAWCYYENDPKNGEKYGKLYNWYAVNDPRGLAPKGYHIPSSYEWDKLVSAMGEQLKKLKSKSGWEKSVNEPITNSKGNGTDDFGFCALPGGCRNRVLCEIFGNGGFYGCGSSSNWWSTSKPRENSMIIGYDGISFLEDGGSVRCIKDNEPVK
jgi:uncharacterized protein (TIGR02145 family)